MPNLELCHLILFRKLTQTLIYINNNYYSLITQLHNQVYNIVESLDIVQPHNIVMSEHLQRHYLLTHRINGHLVPLTDEP